MTTSDKLRPIEPLPDDRQPDWATSYGPKPELVWVAPTSLLVDDTYQRDLNRRSLVLIRRLLTTFAWNKLKPIIAVRVAEGLHVVDGQHGATVAATLGVPQVPVWVVTADTAQERAGAFVAHNQDRLTMSSLDLHRAQAGAGTAVALMIDRVCAQAGVRLRVVGKFAGAKPGDCAAVSSIRSLVVRRGSAIAQNILTALAQASRAPISSAEIDAADVAWHYAGAPVSVKSLTEAIRTLGDDGLVLAKALAATEGVAVKVVLAREYRRLLPGSKAA